MSRLFIIAVFAISCVACQSSPDQNEISQQSSEEPSIDDDSLDVATFAGGCFWCMQPPFDRLDGVVFTKVGYTGGVEENPTYQEVAGGRTGHVEAIEIRYDSEQVSYEELLDTFWRSMDPTDDGGQFADRGEHYRGFVFYHNDDQRELAMASRDDLDKNGPFDEPIVTEIVAADSFWDAEDYHQSYYQKNPTAYERYYKGSGRKGFLIDTWKNR